MAGSLHAETRNQVLGRIGATLIRCQIVERHLKRCLTYVFPELRGEKLTLALLRSLEEQYSRRELGKLLGALRKHHAVAAGFDHILKRFLANRNILVHSMLDLCGLDINSEATGIFLDQLYRDASFVGDTLHAFIERGALEHGHINALTEGRHAEIVRYLDALVEAGETGRKPGKPGPGRK